MGNAFSQTVPAEVLYQSFNPDLSCEKPSLAKVKKSKNHNPRFPLCKNNVLIIFLFLFAARNFCLTAHLTFI
jgi:hypothetical protein